MQLLTFLLGGVEYGIPVQNVVSIENKVEPFRIPDSPQHIDGIIRLHGNIVPVYNLAKRFGCPGEQIRNVIVSSVGELQVGLEVGSVKEIMDAQSSSVNAMPQLMNSTQSFFKEVVARKKELIGVLDVDSLITQEEREGIRRLLDDNVGK